MTGIEKKIVLLGSGGHACSVIDTLEELDEYSIVGFSDIKPSSYRGYDVICNDDGLDRLFDEGIQFAFITVGFMGKSNLREKLYKKLKDIGFYIPTIIDKTATIAKDVEIGEGSFIGKNCVVNSAAKIGVNVIINSGAIIEHECTVGDFSHVAVGACVCGQSNIGKSCLIGANATVIQGLSIGDNCIIGAGSTVLSVVPENATVYGIVH